MSKVTRQQQNGEIRVRLLFFGAARDAAGQPESEMVLNQGTTAAVAFERVLEAFPELGRFGRSLLFAVNQEYAAPDKVVCEGDELALFPPVSGGATPADNRNDNRHAGKERPGQNPASDSDDFFALTSEPLDVGTIARRVVLPQCGATVTLDGYAREWTKGRQTLYLVYEAYAPMALRELQRLGQQAHERFKIARIGIVHRTGKIEIGETSVVITVAAPHRRAAFEACEWAIRELKRTVPIWKKEVFADGEMWVDSDPVVRMGSALP